MLFRKLLTIGAIVFLFNEEFTTDQIPPLAGTRTTEPGGQSITITDTNDIFSIVGSELLFPADASITTSDPKYQSDDLYPRSAGFSIGITVTSNAPSPSWQITGGGLGAFGANATIQFLSGTTNSNQPVINLVTGTIYSLVCISRQENGAYFIALISGTWRLMGITPTTDIETTNPVVISARNATRANGDIDSIKITILPAPFNQPYGLATFTDLGPVVAQSFTHEADFFMSATVSTDPTVSQIEVNFRVQDANNYWQLAITSTTYELWEYVAGAGTLRGSSATVATRPYFSIGCLDETITFWAGTVSASNRRIFYTSASNFKTETDGEIVTLGDGALDDFAVFKCDLSEYADTLSRMVSND